MAETESPNVIDFAQRINNDLEKQESYKPIEIFRQAALKLDKVQKESMLREMRLDRDFYKKVLEEDYRKKNPDSYRYVDAGIRIELLNRNGKLLKQLIDE